MDAIDLVGNLIGIDAADVVERASMDGFLRKMGIEIEEN